MTTIEISPGNQKKPENAGDLLTAIGDTIRTERTERGLTLKQVSEGAHVSVSYLAEIERGEKDPSSRVLENVSEGLGMEISELLTRIAVSLEPAQVVSVADSLAA
ncbi:helix-turn-helix domain-containing protein [Rubrobacter indicoceani]|uniref:helix-turn-helix domain-containing protein n=1 Tax=Rubrobacter indicoceani TaxID=2051957 RepID=UPI0013C4CE44|nr:helix-turn-helix transcriptional regulator [Rubrobacter indicoceani]